MKPKHLAEAVILQAIEDLFSKDHRQESIWFFRGEGFRLASEISGMRFSEIREIETLLKEHLPERNRSLPAFSAWRGGGMHIPELRQEQAGRR